MRFLAAILACAASCAFATPQHKVATGLWIDPNESGWGLNLFHQGDTVWASLFVYGPDGQPRWYTASEMLSTDDGPLHDHPTTVSGDLYEATGPYFGGAFNPASVQRRKVGNMVIDLGNNISGVTYSVDGVRVQKQVVPFTFRADDFAGGWTGYIYDPVTGAQENVGIAGGSVSGGDPFTLRTNGPTSGFCDYTGTRTSERDFVIASGTYTCDKGSRGPWSMRVDVTPNSFVGHFTGPGITSGWGRVAAADSGAPKLEGNGWRSDLWFPPNEGGWGVNILEQGDTIFATLFVYDAQGRPRWYSAPELRLFNVSGGASYIGALQESTGPYFGTAFNANAVTRRQVGTMTFQVQPDGSALLTYGVDGVGVSKVVNRFAFRKNTLTGTYLGHRRSPYGETDAVSITIADDGGTFNMDVVGNGNDASCHYTAPLAQRGEQRRMDGNFTCTNGRVGRFVMSHVVVTWDGFTATFDGNDYTNGRIEGVRREKN
ncbi:MAG TPA: hypothetical protein VM051_00700 [Usitatibacter sp.]|nr:hypothetical protein [Usitatibacter sp.]